MISSGAASPMARDIARIAPVIMPGMAAGREICQTDCHLVQPRAIAACFKEFGIARNASCVEMMIMGRMTSISVRPPANTLRPKGRRK